MKLFVPKAFIALALVAGCASKPESPQVIHADYPYTKPLTSPGGKFGMLPPVVQNSVRAQAGTAEVIDAVRDTSSGRVVYKIYFRSSPTLYVAPDGSVLYPDLTVAATPLIGIVVKPNQVPPVVLDIVDQHYPHAEVARINKEMWHERVVYVFTFKEESKFPRLNIAADGTLMEEFPQ
jgi:hypothetical protein